jgi:Tfp pilus assembly protein PilF
MCFVLGLASACAGRSGQKGARAAADKFYELGLASFHNGLLEDAKIQMDKALAADKHHADAHYLIGLIYLQEGKRMIDALETDVCLEDASAAQTRRRADELHRQAYAEFQAASRDYDEREAGRGRAFNSMAVVSLYFRDGTRAIEEAQAALRAEYYGERYSALSNLGWGHYMRGEYVEAMTELRQALLANAGFCVGRYRLAKVYLESAQNEAALEEIRLVTENTACPIQEAFEVQAAVYLRMGQPKDAVNALDACVSMAPRSCLAQRCEEILADVRSTVDFSESSPGVAADLAPGEAKRE